MTFTGFETEVYQSSKYSTNTSSIDGSICVESL